MAALGHSDTPPLAPRPPRGLPGFASLIHVCACHDPSTAVAFAPASPASEARAHVPSSTRLRGLPPPRTSIWTCLDPGQCCPRLLCVMLYLFSSLMFGNMPRSALNMLEGLAQTFVYSRFSKYVESNCIASFAMRKILFLFHNLGIKLCMQKKLKPWEK